MCSLLTFLLTAHSFCCVLYVVWFRFWLIQVSNLCSITRFFFLSASKYMTTTRRRPVTYLQFLQLSSPLAAEAIFMVGTFRLKAKNLLFALQVLKALFKKKKKQVQTSKCGYEVPLFVRCSMFIVFVNPCKEWCHNIYVVKTRNIQKGPGYVLRAKSLPTCFLQDFSGG